MRDAIKRIGGTLPENISPAEHIKNVETRMKQAIPKLTLDECEAGGGAFLLHLKTENREFSI